MKQIIAFLNLELNERRLNCVLTHKEDIFKQETAFLNKNIPDTRPQNFRVSNPCIQNELHTFEMYTRKHVVWINSAIRNVKRELKKKGFDSSHLSNYENSNLKINICPVV